MRFFSKDNDFLLAAARSGLIVLTGALVTSGLAASPPAASTAAKVPVPPDDFLPKVLSLTTTSRFSYDLVRRTETIPYSTRYQSDPDLEWGKRVIVQEGREGAVITTTRITRYDGREINREVVDVSRSEPVAEVIAKGAKVVLKKAATADGEITYKAKFHVWATSYDGRCPGCRGLTYGGTPVRRGTIAVDPDLIPLGSNLYVPGYGFGRAEDVGGGVKGKRIDLGFENVSQGWWSARWVDVYVLK
jgi:3D (Asp-Asp-Asp) domain-containing protein